MDISVEQITKEQAISFFGGIPDLARALGITRQAVHQWPDMLSKRQTDRVRGAIIRLKFNNPEIRRPS